MIKSFDMHQRHLDGDQNLTMFMREVEDVVKEIRRTHASKRSSIIDSKRSWMTMAANGILEERQVLELPQVQIGQLTGRYV